MSSQRSLKPLTDKQKRVYNFIKKQKAYQGYCPSVREIGDEFDISPKGSYDHLKALVHKGYIEMAPHKSRSIKIIEKIDEIETRGTKELEELHFEWVKIPVLGRVAAGPLTYADQEIEEYLTLPMAEYGDGEYFALRIRGNSMIECGIVEGDIVILHKQSYAQDGDIVVALVEEEATIKRFKRKGNKIYLMPENRDYQPIVVDNVIILGKLTAVYRKY